MTIDDAAAIAGQLVSCLKKQAEQFRGFLDLLVRQREALVAHDASLVECVVIEQEQAIAGARQLEQHRRALTARLAALNQHLEEPFNPAGIRELVAASDASRIDQLFLHIEDLQREIERRQALNRTLIEHSMRCTNETLKWMAGRVQPPSVYDRGNGRPEGEGRAWGRLR